MDLKAQDNASIIAVPDADRLTPHDWKLLAEMQQILQPIYDRTILTKGQGIDGTGECFCEVLGRPELLLDSRHPKPLVYLWYEVAISVDKQLPH